MMNEKNMLSLKEHPPIDLKKIDSEYICTNCNYLMINPHQANDCGCRYCLDCLESLIKTDKKCKQCSSFLTSTEVKYPDKFIQRKINNLNIKCLYKDCNWSGKYEEYLSHYKQHNLNKNNDQKFLQTCDYCQQVFDQKVDYENHLNFIYGNCPKQPIECPLQSAGCCLTNNTDNTNTLLLREDLNDHLNLNLFYHFLLLIDYINSKINNLDLNKSINLSNQFKQEPSSMDIGYESNDFDNHKNINEIKLNKTSNLVTDSYSSFKTKLTDQSLTSSCVNKSETDLKLISNLSRQIDTLQNGFNGLLDDFQRSHKLINKFKQENQLLKENIKELKLLIQELHKTSAMTQVSLLTFEERLLNQEKVSYDGILLWKIPNVHERMQEAKSGRQTSFYSPPFYTNRNGYKMCSRIYLNGDGNGRNTHLSLFFVILRGENDALLRWPFKQKVTFILIDQSSSESRENVYDAFRPDPNSSSFRRPVSDMNIASGLPVFCPLGKLMSSDHEYIKDNTMFIKIIVDTKDLQEI